MKPTQNIRYKRAGIYDIDALINLRVQFTTLLTGIRDSGRVEDLREKMSVYFEETLKTSETVWMLALEEERPIATAGLIKRKSPPNFKNPSGNWGYFVNVYTVPEFRRKGIGRELLEKLMEEGRKENIDSFELHATEEGEFLYKQMGFEIHNEPTYRKYFND